ncbi:MAG: fimbrillin family protein [Aureispira sp.]
MLFLITLSCCLLLVSCGGNAPTDQDQPVNVADSSATDTTNSPKESATARNFSADQLTGIYVFKNPEEPDGNATLALQSLDNGRLKFELTIVNGAPNHHSGTATGELELDGNSAVYTTSEFAMGDNPPCEISFLFIDNMIEIEQAKGTDMSCGFGQGVVARGIYTKINDTPVFELGALE